MHFGLYVPNFGEAINARWFADLAGEAESAGGSKRLIQLEEQGATWWLQSLFIGRNSSERILNQIKEGPP